MPVRGAGQGQYFFPMGDLGPGWTWPRAGRMGGWMRWGGTGVVFNLFFFSFHGPWTAMFKRRDDRDKIWLLLVSSSKRRVCVNTGLMVWVVEGG